MPRVRLKGKHPRFPLGEFSTNHPDDEFRILNDSPTEDGDLRMIVEAETHDSDALVRMFDEAPEVRSYEVLRTDHREVLVQLEVEEPTPHVAGRIAGTLPQYPLILRNGWLSSEMITSWERLSQLRAEFEKADVSFEILSVTQSVEMTDLLTDRQWEVLTEAITRGYYDNPRGCSLSDLADALDVNPSAVSGVLHRAEEHIIKAFVAESKQLEALTPSADSSTTRD